MIDSFSVDSLDLTCQMFRTRHEYIITPTLCTTCANTFTYVD